MHNREIAMRISSKINNQNRFYTDLNGYQVTFSMMVVFVCNFYARVYLVYTGDVYVHVYNFCRG